MSAARPAVPTLPRRRAQNARVFAGVLLLALLPGCASFIPQTAALRESRPADLAPRVELAEVPFFPQDEYQCGPAALATVLAHRGADVTPQQLVPQVYVPERKGSLQVEMLAAARRHGAVSYVIPPDTHALLKEVQAGNPVVVLQDRGIPPFRKWHYAVVVGYDLDEEKIVLRSGETRREVLALGAHEYVWRKSGYWALVAVPPERIPATAQEGEWLKALAAFERVDPRRARDGYAAFLARWPDNLDALIGLANAHYASGDLEQAEAALRRAYARNPDSPVVLNNLAQTLSDQGRHAEALPLAERAVATGGPFAEAAKETRDLIRARVSVK